ncbi:hypothetical protein GWK18_01370 [Kocuria sp. JC486]|uniref:heparinase II/III domain-containing protein n=1 Tax=Kocuria sp. JC486 TaxID=1970736 RepID=UPI0014206C7F|nr:heparinase II/III family protein [Kocuria sp. JC486]NHU84262.1 hypothetical protein [Kocuria sp. JC486]
MALDIAAISQQITAPARKNQFSSALLRGELTLRPHPTWSMPKHLTWTEDPFNDKNWIHQLHMLRWMAPLAQAGRAGDVPAAELWLRHATDWARNNPPGRSKCIAAWANMVDGIRATHLVLGVPMISELFPDSLPVLEKTITEHGAWIADPRHLGHSNHALHQHEGLLLCGIALGRHDWTELAVERIGQLLREQWDAEGINAEGAIAYHRNNYIWWQRLLARLELAGLDYPAGAESLEATPVALAHATRPDGLFVPIGDTDGGSADGVDHPACRYVTSQGSEGEPPQELFKLYRDGYAFGRSGWGEFERDMAEETFFSMPFGRFKVHGHPDGGSLTFAAGGVNWITDPGKYSYTHEDPIRKYVIAHSSHSLVYLPDEHRDRNADVALLAHQEADSHWDITVADQGYADVDLTRRVLFSTSGEYLVVVDTVRADRDVVAVQRWQLGAGVEAESTKNVVALSSGEKSAALYASGTKADTSIIRNTAPWLPEGRIATAWKQSVPAPVVEMTKHGKSFRFVTVLSAGQKTAPKFSTVKGLPAGVLGLTVDNGFSAETMVIRDRDVRVLSGAASTEDAAAALDLAPAPASAVPGRPASAGHATGPARQLTREEHASVLERLARARADAAHLDSAERQAFADELESELRPELPGGDFDLGLEACLSDLRQARSGRSAAMVANRAPLINWAQDETWRPTYYDLPIKTHLGGWNHTTTLNQAGLHTVEFGPLVLPALVEPYPGNTLTVLFHGAINRTKSRLPLFQRVALQRSLAMGPILGFSDATLDLDAQMRLGWYLGAGFWDLTTAMVDVIRGAAAMWGTEHVVLQGNSGGGFAAMQVAAQMPEAHAVVFNPQTDIRRYSAAHARRAFEAAFGDRSDPTRDDELARVSVAHRCRTTGTLGQSLTYVSNSGDRIHVANHELPLLEALEDMGVGTTVNRVDLYLGDGHKPVDNDKYAEIMTSVYQQLTS